MCINSPSGFPELPVKLARRDAEWPWVGFGVLKLLHNCPLEQRREAEWPWVVLAGRSSCRVGETIETGGHACGLALSPPVIGGTLVRAPAPRRWRAQVALGLAALLLSIGLAGACRTGSAPPGRAPAAVRMIPGIGQWAEKEALRRAAESDPFPTATEAGL